MCKQNNMDLGSQSNQVHLTFPPLFDFQAVWLTLKRDPSAGKTRATLDREVSSLEPFLEALPSFCAMLYLKSVNPAFFSYSDKVNLVRAHATMALSMALFLKAGPCFFRCASISRNYSGR